MAYVNTCKVSLNDISLIHIGAVSYLYMNNNYGRSQFM
jgi:hypothetical protein